MNLVGPSMQYKASESRPILWKGDLSYVCASFPECAELELKRMDKDFVNRFDHGCLEAL